MDLGEIFLTPSTLLYIGLEAWLFLLAIAIFYKILTNEIKFAYIFAHDESDTVEPARMQHFLTGMGIILAYAVDGISLLGTQATSLPDIKAEWLAFFTGSTSIYFAGKAVHHSERKKENDNA